ncbi:MAG: phosphoserine phosphatase [Gammaproteobacteria bacterium]|nr:MAG: phosphoserine phosphatase [Gammaproteobacteria bacterium]TND02911.1 MAG: phosphoserine phosphatase [Gammaproteobacteria bacterium]
MSVVVIQGPGLNPQRAVSVAHDLNGELQACSGYWRVVTSQPVSAQQVAALRAASAFDINLLPDGVVVGDVRLLVTDMDSTFINIECVDEIADFAGLKSQVGAITAAAMRGEVNFEQSLTQRVNLLAGLGEDTLDQVYTERLQLNPGGKEMLIGLRRQHIKIALVSGGFTFFTEQLKQRHLLDFTLANVLDITDGKLTGRVVGSIVGADTKAAFLEETCRTLGINTRQAVAIGDGANDLPMMAKAGLSIAYHAKPKVQAQAHAVLNHCGLEGVLGLLNIPVAAK